jgi:hypothetical protein
MVNDHFFDRIKQLKLKTMATMNKKTRFKKFNNKIVEYREQGNVAFQLLVKSQKASQQVDVKELMPFQLTTVPTSIATADNLANTDKSKVFHYLTKDLDDADIPATPRKSHCHRRKRRISQATTGTSKLQGDLPQAV